MYGICCVLSVSGSVELTVFDGPELSLCSGENEGGLSSSIGESMVKLLEILRLGGNLWETLECG